ncbi:MAG TPA: hypothetical protein VJH67_03575 [Candidatus Paceibacterota bacterium]
MRNFITIAVIVIIIVLIAIFGLGGGEATPNQSNNEGAVEGEYSIKEIMAKGEAYQCFIKKGDASGSVDGVVLVSGENARAFFTLSAENLESSFNSNFIVTGGVSYIWTSISPLGFKLPAVNSTRGSSSAAEQASIIGLTDKENMKCEPTEPNEDSFKLPVGINFQEVK